MSRGSLHAILHYVRRVGSRLEAESGQGDAGLLRRFTAQGDEAAFATLVRRHGPIVWGVCTRTLGHTQDAEDAFQATFLVLVRKARSLARPEQLGPWLYGVARRTAIKARAGALRRRAREAPAVHEPATETTPAVVWRDLRPVLDEEIDRLPARYRAPFLLCYLQGLTNDEAARRLGCPRGTVLSRLSRARELLRGRLTRRGIGLSGAALVTALSENLGAAAVPPALLEATVRLAPLFASGRAAEALSLQAAVLAEGVLQTMSLTHVKLTAVVLLILGIAGSGVGLLARSQDPERATAVAQDAPPPADQAGKKDAPPDAEKRSAPAPKREDRARALREQLARRITFAGVEDKEMTLKAVLDLLAKQYGVQFEVDEAAFRAEEVPDVLATPVAGTSALRKRENATLASVLRDVLARVPAESGAVYLIRNEYIDITTANAVRGELGVGPDRALRLVWEDFDNVPFQSALQTLGDASGMNVILDTRAVEADKAKTPVTARFANVQVDTAVRILASMLELQVVKVENVLYVTTEKRANLLLSEQKVAEERVMKQLGAFQGGGLGALGGGLGAMGGGLGALGGGGLGALGGGLGMLGGAITPPPSGGALGIPPGPSGGK
jgi:RNA polymerase sigma factor (sigma-70 family)